MALRKTTGQFGSRGEGKLSAVFSGKSGRWTLFENVSVVFLPLVIAIQFIWFDFSMGEENGLPPQEGFNIECQMAEAHVIPIVDRRSESQYRRVDRSRPLGKNLFINSNMHLVRFELEYLGYAEHVAIVVEGIVSAFEKLALRIACGIRERHLEKSSECAFSHYR
jgi:hypothetical protein